MKIPDGIDYIEAAPLFCAGVTLYKAFKVSKTKPSEWVGVGGTSHLAVQYAVAMGLNVIAVDTGTDKKLITEARYGTFH